MYIQITKIGKNIGYQSFSMIAEHVEIGDRNMDSPYVTINDFVKIGKNCKIFNGAVIGALPQDLKFQERNLYGKLANNVDDHGSSVLSAEVLQPAEN